MGILDGEYDSYNWEYQENYRIYGRYIVCWLLMDYFAGYVPGLLGIIRTQPVGNIYWPVWNGSRGMCHGSIAGKIYWVYIQSGAPKR